MADEPAGRRRGRTPTASAAIKPKLEAVRGLLSAEGEPLPEVPSAWPSAGELPSPAEEPTSGEASDWGAVGASAPDPETPEPVSFSISVNLPCAISARFPIDCSGPAAV